VCVCVCVCVNFPRKAKFIPPFTLPTSSYSLLTIRNKVYCDVHIGFDFPRSKELLTFLINNFLNDGRLKLFIQNHDLDIYQDQGYWKYIEVFSFSFLYWYNFYFYIKCLKVQHFFPMSRWFLILNFKIILNF